MFSHVSFLFLFSDKAADKLTLEKISKASGRLRQQSGKEYLFAIPCKLFSYVVAHTLAIILIYPGSLSVINWALGKTLIHHCHINIFSLLSKIIIIYFCIEGSTLLKGRMDLIKQGGERFKLVTSDKNQIDAMFVDRRNK